MFYALAVAVLIQAPEFEWKVTDLPATDPTQAMHRLTYGQGNNRGQVSATHIGNGYYVTCRHMMVGRTGSFELDGEPVDAEVLEDPIDFVLLRVRTHRGGPAAGWSSQPITTGQRLMIHARLTGKVSGEVHPKQTTDGARKIIVDPSCPITVSGDSGSPVVDAQGLVVGIHVATVNGERATRVVPLAEVKDLLTQPFRGRMVAAQ